MSKTKEFQEAEFYMGNSDKITSLAIDCIKYLIKSKTKPEFLNEVSDWLDEITEEINFNTLICNGLGISRVDLTGFIEDYELPCGAPFECLVKYETWSGMDSTEWRPFLDFAIIIDECVYIFSCDTTG